MLRSLIQLIKKQEAEIELYKKLLDSMLEEKMDVDDLQPEQMEELQNEFELMNTSYNNSELYENQFDLDQFVK